MNGGTSTRAMGALLGAMLLGSAAAQEPESVKQGPEAVFDRPPAEIFAELSNATATGDIGRVGGELVFWEYDLADGSRVYLYACAKVEEVDCEQRAQSICPVVTTVLAAEELSGNIVQRRCRNVAVVGPGDLRPGCVDSTVRTTLAAGLVACH